jgi:hypothetical protein
MIPHISNAFVVVTFHQGMRDEKMLEKLTTYDIQDVAELFSQVDKCDRAAEGHVWHAQPTSVVGKGAKPKVSTAAQGGGSKNKKEEEGRR